MVGQIKTALAFAIEQSRIVAGGLPYENIYAKLISHCFKQRVETLSRVTYYECLKRKITECFRFQVSNSLTHQAGMIYRPWSSIA